MDHNILSALSAINVAQLSRADWISVGMALKEEGFPCSVWDDWSQNDIRYHPGECQKKWDGFRGNSKPVKAGTIIQMAKDRGLKFTFGTNNVDANFGKLEYAIEAIQTCGLTPADLWFPTMSVRRERQAVDYNHFGKK